MASKKKKTIRGKRAPFCPFDSTPLDDDISFIGPKISLRGAKPLTATEVFRRAKKT